MSKRVGMPFLDRNQRRVRPRDPGTRMNSRTGKRHWVNAAVGIALVIVAGCASSDVRRSTPTSTTTSSGPTSIPVTSIPATTTAPAHTVADAVALVKSIYGPYIAASNDFEHTPLLGHCFVASDSLCPGSLDSYLTAELKLQLQQYARTQNADPIVCAQNVPGRITYDPPATSDGAVTIVIHTFYSQSGDNPIRVTVDLNTLKVSHLVCLRPPGT